MSLLEVNLKKYLIMDELDENLKEEKEVNENGELLESPDDNFMLNDEDEYDPDNQFS